jgi:hypothetical protein
MLLAIKVERGDYTHFSKPFFLESFLSSTKLRLISPEFLADTDPDKVFVAQIIRDIDFSFIIEQCDDFILTILLYHDKNDYYRLNTNIKPSNEPEILGIYPIFFKNNNENFIASYFNTVLDIEYNLKIIFNTRYRKIENDYILSTPTLYGDKKFIEKFI